MPELVTSGKLKANPTWHQEGGLAAINDGLELLKSGKASRLARFSLPMRFAERCADLAPFTSQNSAQKLTFTY